MDIQKKLQYYKSTVIPHGKKPEVVVLPAAIKALRDHYQAEVCQPAAPYLKITRQYSFGEAFMTNEHLNLRFLSKQQSPDNLALERCLFFDLETTGLAGGAGTFAFLFGFGFFRNGDLVVQQFFLPEYGREYYLFQELTGIFDSFEFLISYNGKSYDAPLLQTRFIMNRLEPSFKSLRHLDLLHIVRRIWKDSFDSCDLENIEINVLGRQRGNDIPGFLIPQAYFNFLRTGVVYQIKQIIDHNFFDIVSLAELAVLLNRIEQDPAPVQDSAALLRLAGLAMEQNEIDYFNKLLFCADHLSLREKHQIKLWESLMHKRAGQWSAAFPIWQELIQSGAHSFFALEELAKYHEHIQRDFKQALECTNRALQIIDTLSQLDPYQVSEGLKSDFQRRRQRLLEKIA